MELWTRDDDAEMDLEYTAWLAEHGEPQRETPVEGGPAVPYRIYAALMKTTTYWVHQHDAEMRRADRYRDLALRWRHIAGVLVGVILVGSTFAAAAIRWVMR